MLNELVVPALPVTVEVEHLAMRTSGLVAIGMAISCVCIGDVGDAE
jgi:hypothetical protein